MTSNEETAPEDTTLTLINNILSLPSKDLQSLIHKHAKHKDRSHKTHHETHLPALTELPPDSLTTVLIGDSRLERFAWFAPSSKMNQIPNSFNAGVGGDKIENVLYRIGEGLLEALKGKLPRLWIVSAGTNNLRPKGRDGLRPPELEAFVVLVVVLLRTAEESVVLMNEVSYRTDIDDVIVDKVNRQLRDVVQAMNLAMEKERMIWHSLPALSKAEHLLDHVHFNEEGCRIWDDKLFDDVQTLLARP